VLDRSIRNAKLNGLVGEKPCLFAHHLAHFLRRAPGAIGVPLRNVVRLTIEPQPSRMQCGRVAILHHGGVVHHELRPRHHDDLVARERNDGCHRRGQTVHVGHDARGMVQQRRVDGCAFPDFSARGVDPQMDGWRGDLFQIRYELLGGYTERSADLIE
jgi:hypothetical protein